MSARNARVDATASAPHDATVQILLPVHNRRSLTEQFIESLQAQTDRNYRLIVIDDGSSDGTAEMVRLRQPEAVVIRGDGKLWWAGSLERGVEFLRDGRVPPDDIVLLINDDTIFEPGFLAAARSALAGATRSLLLAQLCEPGTDRCIVGARIDWSEFRFADAYDPSEIDCFSTRGLFLRLRDFDAIGTFHRHLLPHYLSDYEFTLRARRAGYSLLTDPRVILEHPKSPAPADARERDAFRKSLTMRSVDNPIYQSTFLLLAGPRRYLARNLLRVWGGFLRQAGHELLARLRPKAAGQAPKR